MSNQNQQKQKTQAASDSSPLEPTFCATEGSTITTEPAAVAESAAVAEPTPAPTLTPNHWRMRKDTLLQIGVLVSLTLGLICALWNLSESSRKHLQAVANSVGWHLQGGPIDSHNSFVYLLMTVFLANSSSQILLDFYTGKNKGYLSAVCRLIPAALGLVAFLGQLN